LFDIPYPPWAVLAGRMIQSWTRVSERHSYGEKSPSGSTTCPQSKDSLSTTFAVLIHRLPTVFSRARCFSWNCSDGV